jgi:hypothetical protein
MHPISKNRVRLILFRVAEGAYQKILADFY